MAGLNDLFMGVPGTQGIDHNDPMAVLRAISAPPQAAPVVGTGTPVSPIAPPPTAAPPQSNRWQALLNLVGPLSGAFLGDPHSRAAFQQGWSDLETQHKKDTQQKNEAGAKYLLEVGQHAMTLTDPGQFQSFLKLAEEAGTRAGWIKPGDLSRQIQFPTSQFAAAKVKEVSDELDTLEKGGYNLDELAKAGSQIALKDGTRIPVATALDLARKRPLMNGQPVPKPPPNKRGFSKIDVMMTGETTPREINYDPDTGKYSDPDTGKEIKSTAFRKYEKPPTISPGSVDAQYNDLIDLWKLGHPGQEPPPDVRTKLRKEANTVNDKPLPPSTGAYGGLDEDGLDYAATQFRLTGRMPPQGRANSTAYSAIQNRAAAQNKALSRTPAAAIQAQMALKSDAAALTRITTMGAAAEAFETKALAQADIVDGLSQKVNRTNYPIINDGLLAGKARIGGDTNTQLLYNALATFTTEYAKIMEGSTGSSGASSDSARAAAARLVSAGLSKGTLTDTLNLMRKEMALTIRGYDVTKAHITEHMGGAPAAPAPIGPPSAGNDPLGLFK